MPMSKLTLTAPQEVIALAKEQAQRENTSISAMFVNFITAKARLSGHHHCMMEIGPLTKSLAGSVKLPDDFDEKEFMSEVFIERFIS